MKIDDDMAKQIGTGFDGVAAGNVASRVDGLQMEVDVVGQGDGVYL
jgi:hypothetical protein